MKFPLLLLTLLGIWTMSETPLLAEGTAPRVRIAIVGLVHDHARGFIPNALRSPDVELVGIVEPDQKLVARYAEKYQLKSSLRTPDPEGDLVGRDGTKLSPRDDRFGFRVRVGGGRKSAHAASAIADLPRWERGN